MARPRKLAIWMQMIDAIVSMQYLHPTDSLPTTQQVMDQAGIDKKKYQTCRKIIEHPEFQRHVSMARAIQKAGWTGWQTILESDKPSWEAVKAALYQFSGIDPTPPARQHNKLEVSGNITFSPARAQAIGSLTPAQRHRMISELEQANMEAMQEYQALPEPCVDAEFVHITEDIPDTPEQ